MTLEVTPEPRDPVPLRTGPPTREELLVHYPGKFSWSQLKTFVNAGDLGLLKRDKRLQKRYDEWAVSIVAQYGSMVKYLLNYRLQWGKTDTITLLQSALDKDEERGPPPTDIPPSSAEPVVQTLPPDAPKYFTADIPAEYISIIQNDWPCSVPADVEHALIWTRVPVYHPDIVHESIKDRIGQDGVWGFTGHTSPPPTPSNLPSCLPALAEWGVTRETMVVSAKGTIEEEALVRRAGMEVETFVKRRWNEDEWETVWFVGPPRLTSIPGLAHIHVFAKLKKQEVNGTNGIN